MGNQNQANFTKDFAQLQSDASLFAQYQANAATQAAALAQKIDSCNNVYELIALIYSSISPQLEASEAPYGAAEKVQADIQKCNNDIHNLTNEDSSDPALVTDVSADAGGMMWATGASPTVPVQTAIQEADGTTTNQSLYNNFLAIQ